MRREVHLFCVTLLSSLAYYNRGDTLNREYEEIGTPDLLFFSGTSMQPSGVGDRTVTTRPRAFFYPSLHADGALHIDPDEDRLVLDALVACRDHLIDRRGLPLDEILLTCRQKNYLWQKVNGFWSISLEICKELLPKSKISYQSCDTEIALLSDKEKCVAYCYAHDIRPLDGNLLFRLAHNNDARIDSLVLATLEEGTLCAVSYHGAVTPLSLYEMGDLLLALCSLGVCRCGCAYRILGSRLEVRLVGMHRAEYRLF